MELHYLLSTHWALQNWFLAQLDVSHRMARMVSLPFTNCMFSLTEDFGMALVLGLWQSLGMFDIRMVISPSTCSASRQVLLLRILPRGTSLVRSIMAAMVLNSLLRFGLSLSLRAMREIVKSSYVTTMRVLPGLPLLIYPVLRSHFLPPHRR